MDFWHEQLKRTFAAIKVKLYPSSEMKSPSAGTAEEDRNRCSADDPGQGEENGRNQTLCGTQQSECIGR